MNDLKGTFYFPLMTSDFRGVENYQKTLELIYRCSLLTTKNQFSVSENHFDLKGKKL